MLESMEDPYELAEGFTASCGCDRPLPVFPPATGSQKASQLAVVVTPQEHLNSLGLELTEGFTAGCGCDGTLFIEARVVPFSQKASQLAVVVTNS